MDKFQELLNRLNGQKNIGNTADNKGQCVGLVMVWIKDTLGLPHIWGHAKDLLANADKNAYQIIYNTPTGVPQRGDVIVWGQSFNGNYGHTAIATGKGDVNTFEVFEQNMPLGNSCRLTTYKNYNHVLGWIRPKIQNQKSYDTYKGYDFNNKESMKAAIDVLVRVQNGEFVDKVKYDALVKQIEELNKELRVALENTQGELKQHNAQLNIYKNAIAQSKQIFKDL